jgi:hypothetical protein
MSKDSVGQWRLDLAKGRAVLNECKVSVLVCLLANGLKEWFAGRQLYRFET